MKTNVGLLDLFALLYVTKKLKKKKDKQIEKDLQQTFGTLPKKTIKRILDKIHLEVEKKLKDKKK